jgi:hypothetical protein
VTAQEAYIMKARSVRTFAVGLVLVVAVPATASAAEGFWGQLQKVGDWARTKVMKRGYLGTLIEKVARHHPTYARMLKDALRELNAALGRAQGCWPNLRLALANLIAGAARGAGTKLSDSMKPVLDALKAAPPLIGRGGKAAVIKAIQEVLPRLDAARPFFKRHLRTAIRWLKRKCDLWAPGFPKTGAEVPPK